MFKNLILIIKKKINFRRFTEYETIFAYLISYNLVYLLGEIYMNNKNFHSNNKPKFFAQEKKQ